VQADVYVDSSKENAIERVKAETEGFGADVVITACSSGKAQEQSLEMVSKRGVVNFFGGLPKDSPYIKFDSNLTHYREFYVVGNHGSAPRHNELALALLGAGKIQAKPLISHRFGIADTLKGITTTEQAQGLKVVIAEA
jgi:L-iditol 2-dehydrogenase